jgi:ADP-ribose pyrophosphatase
MSNPWKTLETKLVYENAWLRLRQDSVIRPDGNQGIYSVVELPPSVGIVAIDDSRRVALVTQWRYVHNKVSIEIPTGSSSERDGSLRATAERELVEETGLTATHWRELGSIDNSNGATTDVAHLFLATDLDRGPSHQDSEESVELSWHPYGDAVNMVMSGAITESVSVAGILKTEVLRSSGQLSF